VLRDDRVVALANLRAVLIDSDTDAEGVLPFCPYYSFFVSLGATPLFNRKGEVFAWRGVRIALELAR
jgi:hypothetical protein